MEKTMSRKTTEMQAIDRFVGKKIKWYRIQKGLSQHSLAKELGISYQQLHKYENGSNSVSASRLAEISVQLGTPVEKFFEGYSDTGPTDELMNEEVHRQQLQLAKYFNQITNPKQRDAIHTMIRVLANEE